MKLLAAQLFLLTLLAAGARAGDHSGGSWAAADQQGPDRRLLQQQGEPAPAPANCSALGDVWTPARIACTLEGGYSFTCNYVATSGNALCRVQGPLPTQLIGMTCPVKQGKAVCDLVVMQNFSDSEHVFAVTALLAAWAPGA